MFSKYVLLCCTEESHTCLEQVKYDSFHALGELAYPFTVQYNKVKIQHK